jgi:hypothetical protein
MPTVDSLLFDAGWLFLAVWGVLVILVSVAAFREDLFPAVSRWEPRQDVPRDVRRPERASLR